MSAQQERQSRGVVRELPKSIEAEQIVLGASLSHAADTSNLTQVEGTQPGLQARSNTACPSPLDLARVGWAVIPVQQGGKAPLVRWEAYQATAPGVGQVEEWVESFPHANWAVVLGAVSGGLVAVDLDSGAAHNWADTQGGLWQPGGPWAETGDGWVYFFSAPGELCERGVVLPHGKVEILADRHTHLIPPSIHGSGKRYLWRRVPDLSRPIPTAPEWILALLRGEEPRRGSRRIRSSERLGLSSSRRAGSAPASRLRSAPRYQAEPNGEVVERLRWILKRRFGTGQRNRAVLALAIAARLDGLPCDEAAAWIAKWAEKHLVDRRDFSERDVVARVRAVYEQRRPYRLSFDQLVRLADTEDDRMPHFTVLKALEAAGVMTLGTKSLSQCVNRPELESLVKLFEAIHSGRTAATDAERAALAGIPTRTYQRLKAALRGTSYTDLAEPQAAMATVFRKLGHSDRDLGRWDERWPLLVIRLRLVLWRLAYSGPREVPEAVQVRAGNGT